MRERFLERELARTLGVACRLASAARPCELSALSPREREQYAKLGGERRREAWLCGRAAWKRLLRQLGEDQDTARFSLPSERFSLTHAAGLALAIGVAPGSTLGIGVDLELDRAPSPDAARFFLTDEEQRALAESDSRERAALLLRLWTIKEALFKSDLENHGRILKDYRLATPLAATGVARPIERAAEMHYASFALPRGFLSVALVPFPDPLHALPARRERALAAQLL